MAGMLSAEMSSFSANHRNVSLKLSDNGRHSVDKAFRVS